MQKPTFEKVVFRKDWNPYTKDYDYLACYPEDEALPGRIAYVAFRFVGEHYWDGDMIQFDPHGEMDLQYYYTKTKIVHKDTDEAQRCLSAIETFYDCKNSGHHFRVMEKIS